MCGEWYHYLAVAGFTIFGWYGIKFICECAVAIIRQRMAFQERLMKAIKSAEDYQRKVRGNEPDGLMHINGSTIRAERERITALEEAMKGKENAKRKKV